MRNNLSIVFPRKFPGMCRRRVSVSLLLILCSAPRTVAQSPSVAQAPNVAQSPSVVWSANDDGTLVARVGDASFVFRPEFTMLLTESDPKLAMRPADIPRVSYNVPTWYTGVKSEGVRNVDTAVAGGDGLDPSILAGDNKGRTPDYLRSAPRAVISATSATRDGAIIMLAFESHPVVELSASINLDAPHGPALHVEMRAKRVGWYSIGYTGAPAIESGDVEEVFQPLIWQERRMPDRSYATAAFECTIPGTLVQRGGATLGVLADPVMLPYQPLPRLDNSQFAVVLRDNSGNAQPMVFAPILGGAGSKLAEGDTQTLDALLYVAPQRIVDAYENIARKICRFSDHRENLDISLNDTLTNIIDYGMSEYAQFNTKLRGCAYETDVPDAVKNVSALNPLEVALIFDDESIYRERALPIWEYLLSREKLLFNLDPTVKTQSPSNKMLGPCANVSELAVWHMMSGKRDYVSRAYAEQFYGAERKLNLDVPKRGNNFWAAMELFAATGDEQYAKRRDSEVKRYLEERIATAPTDFSDRDSGGMFFWTSYAPRWMELFEVWMRTRDRAVLQAATTGARYYPMFTWMLPTVPDGDVTVNPGGLVPHYGYLKGKGHPQMHAPEHDVPAWWVDALGLTPESSGTASGHRGILMATYAPWMLRVAQDANVPYLRDVARSAVIGRYRNFPGYHINTARTDVFMAADYPLRPHKELSYNSFHYNHIWPLASMLIDYLVSDTYDASDGAIDFPAHFSEGYAYLRQRIYGDRPGKFYDRSDAWLWMPRNLLTVSNPQLNYVAARTNDELLLAFTNQSKQPVRATLQFNIELAGLGSGAHAVHIWRDNKDAGDVELTGGALEIEVSPRSITAIAIAKPAPRLTFQPRVLGDRRDPLGANAHRVIAVADCRAMLLTMGRTLTNAYAYSRALPGEFSKITWSYRRLGDNGAWSESVDDSYPFEVSFPVEPDQRGVELKVTAERADGTVEQSESVVLSTD